MAVFFPANFSPSVTLSLGDDLMTTIILECKSAVLEQHVRAESECGLCVCCNVCGMCVLNHSVVCVLGGALCMYTDTLCVSRQYVHLANVLCMHGLCLGWVLACLFCVYVLALCVDVLWTPCMWSAPVCCSVCAG